MKSTKETIIQIIWLAVVISLFVLSWKLIRSGNLEIIINSLGIWGPVLIILLKVSTLVIAPLGGSPLYIISGALYGIYGFFIVLLGDIIGSLICYFLSRHYGQRILGFFIGSSNMDSLMRIVGLLGNTKSLLKVRIIALQMPEIFAYAAGLAKVKFSKFALIHFIFLVPISFTLVFLGSRLSIITEQYPIVGLAIVVLIPAIGLLFFYKDYRKAYGM
jgi:uncharacterized membrane protein YdjX (TVP38/TMEM64 family)